MTADEARRELAAMAQRIEDYNADPTLDPPVVEMAWLAAVAAAFRDDEQEPTVIVNTRPADETVRQIREYQRRQRG